MTKLLPPLKPRVVIRTLLKGGFYVHHQSGSHYILKHLDRPDLRITVAYHNKELKRKTLASIVEQSGLSIEDFLALL